jgi:hypothetical protein
VITTKPGASAPGICLLSRGAVPRGAGAAVRGWCLATAVIVVRSRGVQLWAELPALAPGARCRVGWSLGPGHLRRCSGRRESPPGNDTPQPSEIRRECWSRGRIVSALLQAAQGGCRPSMEPPNPVAATMDLPAGAGKLPGAIDTGLHREQRGFMKVASRGWPGSGSSAASCSVQRQRAAAAQG